MPRGPDKKPRKRWCSGTRECQHCQQVYAPQNSVQRFCGACAPTPAFWRRIILFGVSKREFDAMLLAQNNGCAICEKPIDDSAHVDHDHVTMQVRGLLCTKCNLRLCVLDDKPFVEKAQAYLLRCSTKLECGTVGPA